jgi:hypothetical protein
MSWINKIDRAKQHLEELQKEISVFFKLQPYRISTKRDPKTKRLIYYLTDVMSVPDKIALISGDIVQNLRSALDHLAYDLFMKENKETLSAKHIYFPIEKDLQTYEREKVRKTKGISSDKLKLIDSIRPYKGGNDTLWAIATLNNIDKHRLLMTVGSTFGSVDVGALMIAQMRKLMKNKDIPDIPVFIRPADNLFPLKRGDELFIDSPDAEVNHKMQFRFEVVLNEKDIVEGQPVITALESMIKEVEKLIPIFKK